MTSVRARGVAVVAAVLLAASCAGGTGTTHPAQAGEPPVAAVAGYTYTDFSAAERAGIDIGSTAADLNASVPGVVTGWSVHHVVPSSGDGSMTVVELGIDRTAAPTPFPETALLETLLTAAAGALAPMSERTIRGIRVGVVELTQGGQHHVIHAWLRGDVATVVVGSSAAAVGDFSARAIAAQEG